MQFQPQALEAAQSRSGCRLGSGKDNSDRDPAAASAQQSSPRCFGPAGNPI